MFPCLLSVPHGGTLVPPEVKEIFLLSHKDLLEDGDPFTPELYSLEAYSLLVAKVARAVVDLNRAPDDLPPKNPDGVIKSETAFGKRVYRELPGPELVRKLLDRYYFPYHRRLKEELLREDVLIAFDRHSMAPTAPKIAPDRGKRPAVCLGNFYGRSCPEGITFLLRDCFVEAFNLPPEEVTVNVPFAGGYITRTYGIKPKPWIQIKINREFYMDWENLSRDERKLKEVREKLVLGLSLFFERGYPLK